jgi:hypothetical protein
MGVLLIDYGELIHYFHMNYKEHVQKGTFFRELYHQRKTPDVVDMSEMDEMYDRNRFEISFYEVIRALNFENKAIEKLNTLVSKINEELVDSINFVKQTEKSFDSITF